MHGNPTARPATGHVFIRQMKDGKRSVWYAKYRLPDGQQVKKRLGPAWTEKGRPAAGYLNKKAAESELSMILREADSGTLAVHTKTGVSFTDAAREFLRYIEVDRERDPATVADYRGVIEGYLIPRFGERPIESISDDDITAYRDALKKDGRALRRVADDEKEPKGKLSNRVIVRHLVVLNGIFRRARQVWKLPVNPAAAELVDRPSVRYDSGKFDVLDPDEVRLLIANAKDEQTGALYLVAAFTGLRQGELFALRWRDVDFSRSRVYVRENFSGKRLKRPKSGKVRSAPMSDDVVVALDKLSKRENYTAPDDLVFPAEGGGHLDDMAVRRAFYAALTAAKLKRVRFHDLRHTFGTQAAQKLSPVALQAYMGHAHFSTTERYLHYVPAVEDAAKLTEVFGGGSPTPEPTPVK
jgi:integrase